MNGSAPFREKPAHYHVRRAGELHQGDRMDAVEFMRRYELQPEDFRAELINGIVRINMQPISAGFHGLPDHIIQLWLGNYALGTIGVLSLGSSTVKLGPKNVPEPDSLLLLAPRKDWRRRVDEKGYLVGPPELAVEISASTRARDVRGKFSAYCKSGIREYLVWRVKDRAVDWWELQEGAYASLLADKHGIVKSHVFPGLWLNIPALLADDPVQVMATLQKGLASADHAAFVKKLRAQEK
jgi:Uma2 family endonuclease